MTALPADTFRIPDRGRIAPGYVAEPQLPTVSVVTPWRIFVVSSSVSSGALSAWEWTSAPGNPVARSPHWRDPPLVIIRQATEGDWPEIWPIFHAIVSAAETYPYSPDMSSDDACAMWLSPAPDRTVVAVDDGTIVGTARMHANRPGPGAHVASASYMVDPAHSGRGVGRALCEDSLDWARHAGFRAMQFNAVAESNTAAVRLYRSLGFTIIGTVPEAFRHPTLGYVGLHIMHRPL